MIWGAELISSYKRKLIEIIDSLGLYFSKILKKILKPDSRQSRKVYDIILFPFDYYSINFSYRDVFGRFPKLFKPETFSEYIQHNKLFDRKPIYTECADKVNVREFVKKEIGENYLPKLLWSGRDDLFTFDIFCSLPDRFVIKANNGSGAVKIVKDKKSIDFSDLKNDVSEWLKFDFSQKHKEWQYRWIPPLLLVEEFLETSDLSAPDDYKFYCINGDVVFCNIHLGRFSHHKSFFVDREYKILPISRDKYNVNAIDYERLIDQKKYIELMKIAEKLSINFKFVRVDLYYADQPYFGELTFSPAAGLRKFYPEKVDTILGKILRNEATIIDIANINTEQTG